jgi:hypothetical protein
MNVAASTAEGRAEQKSIRCRVRIGSRKDGPDVPAKDTSSKKPELVSIILSHKEMKHYAEPTNLRIALE